jgi:protein involved in polysaccharide export with SLBB domain
MTCPPSAIFRHGSLLAFVLVLLLAPSQALGQNRSLLDLYKDRSRVVPRNSIGRMSEEAKQFSQLSGSSGALAPLEGAIDDSTYIVGPNDQFTITVGGLEPVVSPSVVSSDGILVLPGIGRVHAAGRLLVDVRGDAIAKLQDGFRNVEVDIALSVPREFYVHVSGAVPEPGRYVAMPVARVEDVLKMAFFSRTFEAPTANEQYRPALRNVRVRRTDGTEISLDLVRYYRTGEVGLNPFLRDGDAIQVPAFETSSSAVFIDGDVAFPGVYDFRPGDTILDLLEIGSGDSPIDDNVTIQHTRRSTGSFESSTYTLRELREGMPVAVQPLDHVHVPMSNPTQGLVSVEGWVHFPGRYPIVAGKTSLVDLVAMAGGVRDGALLRAAFLERDIQLEPKRRDLLAELEHYELEQAAQTGAGRWEGFRLYLVFKGEGNDA